MIQFENFSKKFNGKNIITNFSYKIEQGTIVVILGRSGSGKTTFLRCLVGLDTDYSGTIQINKTNQSSYLTKHKISLISQKYTNFPWLSVKHNICIGSDPQDNQIVELSKKFGMSEVLEKYPHQLSGGMNQRIAIMRAILQDTQILCADEPFGALDVINKETVQPYFYNALKQNNITGIIVTHDIDEALHVADIIFIVKDGDVLLIQNDEKNIDDPYGNHYGHRKQKILSLL